MRFAATGDAVRRRWLAHGLLAAGLLAALLLVVYPPERFGFYPACPIRMYLHIDCPGCGATRALAALLRGRLGEAVQLNALFVGLLPLVVGFASECYRRAVWAREYRWPAVPVQAVYAALGVVVVFTVARNVINL